MAWGCGEFGLDLLVLDDLFYSEDSVYCMEMDSYGGLGKNS
jgi:hypothetical protein